MCPKLRQEQLGEALDRVHVLAHLRALEIVAAVEARPQDEMAFLQRAGADENIEDFLLNWIHVSTLRCRRPKNKIILRAASRVS
jgi:hypothetical protein